MLTEQVYNISGILSELAKKKKMKNEDIFISDLKNFLLSRRRCGGELIVFNRTDCQNVFSDDLRGYMTSEVLGFVGKNCFCFIAEESTSDKLLFLDVSRGVRINGAVVEMLGYFYENGQVVSYVIDRYNKNEDNNGWRYQLDK